MSCSAWRRRHLDRGDADQKALEAGGGAEPLEGGVEAQPAGGNVERDLEKGLEVIQGALGLAGEQVDPG